MEKQKLAVLQFYNNKLDNDHLSLYLSQRLRGQPLSFLQWLKKLPQPVGITQDALDELYYYCNENDLAKLPQICNMFSGYHPDFDKQRIEDQLNENLELIGIDHD